MPRKRISMKKIIILLVCGLTVLFVAGCAAGPNEMANSPDEEGEVAGFWQGLWHGMRSHGVRSHKVRGSLFLSQFISIC